MLFASGLMAIVLLHLSGAGALAAGNAEALEIMRKNRCGACHIIPGIAEATGKTGPSLKALNDRARIAGGQLNNTSENLREWLKDPAGIISGTMMPRFGFSETELDILVAFLETL